MMSWQTTALTLSFALLLWQPASGEDQEFQQFYPKFKQFIQNNDKNGIASMTRLPFLWNGTPLDKTQFLKQFNKIFPGKMRRCFVKEPPRQDEKSYFVICGEHTYTFSKVHDEYLFTDIDAND